MTSSATAKQALAALSESADAEKLQGMDTTILFDLSGEENEQWTVTIQDGQVDVAEGSVGSPAITVEITAADLKALIQGDLNPMAAFMKGRLKVKGDISMAMQLQNLFS